MARVAERRSAATLANLCRYANLQTIRRAVAADRRLYATIAGEYSSFSARGGATCRSEAQNSPKDRCHGDDHLQASLSAQSMLAPLLFISSLLLPPAPQLRTPLRPTRYLRRTAGEPLQQLTMQTPTGGMPSEAVPVEIEATAINSRCISASIVISASPAQVWSILTGKRCHSTGAPLFSLYAQLHRSRFKAHLFIHAYAPSVSSSRARRLRQPRDARAQPRRVVA